MNVGDHVMHYDKASRHTCDHVVQQGLAGHRCHTWGNDGDCNKGSLFRVVVRVRDINKGMMGTQVTAEVMTAIRENLPQSVAIGTKMQSIHREMAWREVTDKFLSQFSSYSPVSNLCHL
jgi:hypothetical protein